MIERKTGVPLDHISYVPVSEVMAAHPELEEIAPEMWRGMVNGVARSETAMSEGRKDDHGKLPIDLVDPETILAIAAVLEFGARKYERENWRKGIAWSRLYAGVQRHMLAFWMGQDDDPETGLSHLSHAMCGLMFLHWHVIHRVDLDDRFIGPDSPR